VAVAGITDPGYSYLNSRLHILSLFCGKIQLIS
jgi:hypothetical protein